MLSDLREILFIVNPCSGTLRGRESFFEVVRRFCDADIRVSVRMTQYREHAKILAAQEGRNFPAIICCGGDGTLHEVICGIMEIPFEQRPQLGYIPAGSTNDFANSLGLPSDPIKSAEHLLSAKPELLDVGWFQTNESAGFTNFIYTASIGAFTSSSYRTPQRVKNAVGYMAYVLDALGHLDSIRPTAMRFETENGVFEDEYIFASISNTTTMGGVLKLKNVTVDFTDGLFELILIKNPKSLKDADEVARSLLQSSHGDPNVGLVRAQVSSLRVQMNESAPWTLDGECAVAPASLEIRNLKKQLPFLL